MNSLDGILKLADNELNQMVNSGKFRSRDDVDIVYKLVDIVKDVHCVASLTIAVVALAGLVIAYIADALTPDSLAVSVDAGCSVGCKC